MSESNALLAALPAEERAALLKEAVAVSIDYGEVVCEQDQPLRKVYFPLYGAISLNTLLSDGSSYESAIIGREGVLGFPLGIGEERQRWRSIAQLETEALVLDREAMRRLVLGGGHLAPLMIHYSGLLVSLAAQSAACGRFHGIDQRCARWLLLMHDRAEVERFPITHEFFSDMLGAHRPTVTVAVQHMRDAGAIRYERGMVTVLERSVLEGLACECYARMQEMFQHVVHVGSEREGTGQAYPDVERASGEGSS